MFVYILITVGLVFLGLALRVPFLMRKDYLAKKYWKSLPTVDEYMTAMTIGNGRGICCLKCGSNQIWEQHLWVSRQPGKKQIHGQLPSTPMTFPW